MHINNWVHASDLMKMVKSANSISTLSSEEGLPDNHVITIRERELTVDFPELIQNNIKTDTVTLDLDAEWDGIQPVIIFGPNADGTIAVEYTGEPVHIPGAVMQYVGGLDCSVMGLDDSGEVRLVTKAAPNTFEVVESGEYIGQISEDDVSLLGQILSAIKDVEAATSDASSAAEDATAAADSANTAAAKATNASNSANTAAAKATAAANSANTASERAENAYDVLTPIIAEIGVNGNQPRATTNPNYIATASDAYAAKPLEICIKGKTWVNRWPAINNTVNGITVSTDGTGLVTITGTATANAYIGHNITSIAKNTNLTLVRSTSTTGIKINVHAYNASGFVAEVVSLSGSSDNNKATGNTGNRDLTHLYYNFEIASGTTVNASFRIMLVDGTEAPDCFTPPASITSVQSEKLVTAGKNLLRLKPNLAQSIVNGITFTPNADGSITVNGTATGPAFYNIDFTTGLGSAVNTLPQGEIYVLSGNSTHCVVFCGYFTGDSSYENWIRTNGTLSGALPSEAKKLRSYIQVNTGDVVDNEVVYPQLELGSTATAYEPPTVTQTPLPEVELRSLPNGTCDELVIRADGTCEVERKTAKIVLNGAKGQIIGSQIKATHGGYYFDMVFDMPDNGDGVRFSPASQVTDKLLVGNGDSTKNTVGVFMDASRNKPDARISVEGIETAEEMRTYLQSDPITLVYTTKDDSTEPQAPVTLPTLPSPNITVYHDSDVPSDITVEYVQDINIVLDNLNAKIAALNIAQSISS